MSAQAATAMRISMAVLQACTDGPAPEGPLYAAAMAHGCTAQVWEEIVSALVAVGMLERVGKYQLRATAKGREMAKLAKLLG